MKPLFSCLITRKFIAAFCLLFAIVETIAAQNTVVTYQGRLLNAGTAYSGTGQFQFALVTSTNVNHQARANANLSAGFVTTYTMVFGGNGYVVAPAVHITGGGGSNATATATISGGAVTGVSAVNPGSGYTNAPTVTIDPPPANINYTTYWSNDGTSVSGSEPAASVSVAVTNGLFTVALGDTTLPNMAAVDASLFNQADLQLRIWFNDGVNGFAVLNPAQNLTATPYAAVASRLQGGLTVRQTASGSPNVLGGASINFIGNVMGATIGGGGITNYGGINYSNSVKANFGTIGGGYGNTVNISESTIGGGVQNTINGIDATIAGGIRNTANGPSSTIGGGAGNITSNSFSTVAGGQDNTASGQYATVPGGNGNVASGFYSFAAGYRALASHYGSFVWSDTSGSFASTAADQFAVRAEGGIVLAGDVAMAGGAAYHKFSLNGGNSIGYLYGSYPAFGDGIHIGYNYYADANGANHVNVPGGATSRVTMGYGFVGIYVGGVGAAPNTQRLYADATSVTVNGTFNNFSDRNAKQDFAAVSPAHILERVGQLPISEWSYKEDPQTRHVGPMAQDFYAAFNIGTDDKHIAPIDEGGVALAAIQALNQRLEETRTENAALKVRLEKLENLLLKK